MGLKNKIESLLFIAAKPIASKQLASLVKRSEPDVKAAAEALIESYKKEARGVQIIKNNAKYQMVSSSENTKLVSDYIKDETTGELTRPSLETLTIVAYRGSISKLDLDRIRGVNCSLIIRNLLLRGLIEAKKDKKRRETYYNITFDFIRFLGLNEINELPDYERLHKDDTIDRMLNSEAEK